MSFLSYGGHLSAIVLLLLIALVHATNIRIQNSCPFTVWAAAVPGGGRQLEQGQAWNISVLSNTTNGRIWGRTNCSFNGAGRGSCVSGGCDGLLECRKYGSPPNTIAEYSLNIPNNMDFFDVSVVEGFNIPMRFTSGGCRRGPSCVGDINGQCPTELTDPGGCNNPCTVFMNDQYCCKSAGSCEATVYSRFFKDRCPDAYSYPMDDATSLFSCPSGSAFTVVFCP